MANVLTNIMAKILARGLVVLRERCSMPRMVNSDYSTEAVKKGKTIDVPIPTAVGVRDVTPSNTPPAPVDTTPEMVQVPLDTWKQTDPFHLTDKDMVEIDANRHFLPMQMGEAVRSLANTINMSIHSCYKDTERGVYGFVGTPGTTPFGSGVGVVSATEVRKVLNQQLCPRDGRFGVLDFDAEASALALAAFSDAEKIMSANVKLEGEIGRKFGINWTADDHVPYHVAGTIDDGGAPNGRTCAVNNGAGYDVGDNTINVDNGAEVQAAGTIVVGDIISFAGHSQTYCVVGNLASNQYDSGTEAYTFSANAIGGLKLYPALKAAVADDEVITVEASHRVNLVGHRDGIAFAMRPLIQTSIDRELGGRVMAMQDPQTGLVLRLEVSRQHKQTAWELDALWGNRLVRPELLCRLAG